VAIDREGSKKPKTADTKDPTPVAAVLDKKKKAIAAKKTPAKKAPAKKKTAAKKPAAKKKAAPKLPKTEREWITYIEKSTVADLLAMAGGKQKLTLPAQHALKKKMAELHNLLVDLPTDFNGWLDFFSTMTRDETEKYMEEHVLTLDNPARAAGQRWILIYENPVLIDRLVTSRLQQEKKEDVGSILAAARSGDRQKTFEAARDNLAYKLEEGAGARDMSVLFKQLNDVMLTLDEIYREKGIKDEGNSSIRKLLIKSRKMASRPKARQAAMTIAEAEAEDEDDE
jgi:hypothetical protein